MAHLIKIKTTIQFFQEKPPVKQHAKAAQRLQFLGGDASCHALPAVTVPHFGTLVLESSTS